MHYGMDRLSRRVLSKLRVENGTSFVYIVTALAFLLLTNEVAVAAGVTEKSSKSPFTVVRESPRGEPPPQNDALSLSLRSEINSFEASTSSVLHEGNVLLGVVQNISHRIFQFADDQPQENWPELKFGWRTVSAVILGGIGAALSSAGGLGGGGLFVPLFNLLLQFDAKTSAALSNFMILGGSVSNLWLNLQQHHPHARNKPLIDFDVVLLLQPNMLLGISTGVILNVVLPEWVITALLTVTLGYMTIHSFKGGLRRWKKETNQNRQRKIAAAAAAAEERKEYGGGSPYVPAPDFHHDHSDSTEGYVSDDEDGIDPPSVTDETNINPSLTVSAVGKEVGDEESSHKRSSKRSLKQQLGNGPEVEAGEISQPLLKRQVSTPRHKFPVDKGLALGFTWLAFFFIQVLRGSGSTQSILGLKECGLGYWILTLFQIPLAFFVTFWTVRRLQASHAANILVVRQEAAGTEVVEKLEDGFVLTPKSCTLLSWMALIAGLLGGLLGIGGGMIVNPLLLTVGMIPQVTAGTCASMVFFSSSMSVVEFWLMGRVPVDYALSAAVLCAIFSGFGVKLVHRAIDKYNRASIIVFSVTLVMGVSTILMAGFGGFDVWEEYVSGGYMGFHNFC
ncbi:unnamed protein product [Calypogeia fissa]